MAIREAGDERYPQFANDIQYWMDDRVSDAGKSIYRGALQVLTAGFGKGLLATAALIAIGIVTLAIAAPAVLQLSIGLSVAQSVEAGLIIAGNTLLAHPVGIMALFTGGAVGSLTAAHGENSRISKEAAQLQAMQFSRARGSNAGAAQPAVENDLCTGGHCAKLLREQHRGRDNEHGGQAR